MSRAPAPPRSLHANSRRPQRPAPWPPPQRVCPSQLLTILRCLRTIRCCSPGPTPLRYPLSLPCAAPLHPPSPRRAHRLAPRSPRQASAKRKEAKALQEKAEKAAKAAAEAEAEPEAAAAE